VQSRVELIAFFEARKEKEKANLISDPRE